MTTQYYDFLAKEKEAETKSPEQMQQEYDNAAVLAVEDEKNIQIKISFAKSQIQALNELEQDQSLKDALQILVTNFTFILQDTKGVKKGIIFAGPYGTQTWDEHDNSMQNYTSEFITYSSILNNTKHLLDDQNNRPKGIFSKATSVALHTSTTDEVQRRINKMEANKPIYESVSDKFLELWKEKFKKNMAAAHESEQTDDKFTSLLKTGFFAKLDTNSLPDYLFNLVIMYLFPIQLKYVPVPLVYGLRASSAYGHHTSSGIRIYNECIGILDDNYKKAIELNLDRKENAVKFKNSPNTAVGGRRTKRRKSRMRQSIKKMRIKQNTKMNKQRRTYRRRR